MHGALSLAKRIGRRVGLEEACISYLAADVHNTRRLLPTTETLGRLLLMNGFPILMPSAHGDCSTLDDLNPITENGEAASSHATV